MEAMEKPKRILMPMRSDERLAQKIASDVLSRYAVSSVLDVGCGDGVVGRQLPAETKYRGLDISDACIYEQDSGNASIQYIQADQIPDLMQKEGPWDMILLLDVIEHTRSFTGLFEKALESASKYVVVSLPNELFFLDRLRMLFGSELNAHSLDLLGKPDGFKHQYIINIRKARNILNQSAISYGFTTKEEISRPLVAKKLWQRPISKAMPYLIGAEAWSMGSVFVFARNRSQ